MAEKKVTKKRSSPGEVKILKEIKKGNDILKEIRDILDKQWREIDPQ